VRQSKKSILPVLSLVCLLLLSACGSWLSDPRQTLPQGSGDGFACTAVDGQGSVVRGFFREEDQVWYLVIPSSWDLEELKLQCGGEILHADAGVVDQASGSVSGAFSRSGDRVVLQTGAGELVTVSVLQSSLPSVQIQLGSATLEDIHEDKGRKTQGNTVLITEADGRVDVEVKNKMELKGRGNSSWRLFDKKGYQIKFSGEISVLGMKPAAKWVLLANSSDDSMVRTQVVYQAARQMGMAFVPELQYVELWIDGDYRGTYLMGEKVELSSSRLDLKHPLAALFERDDAFYEDEEVVIHNDYLNAWLTLKDSISGDRQLQRKMITDFSLAVDRLMEYLYTTPSGEVTLEKLSEMIDVDSVALYYLVNEFTLNRESMSTSFYWYMDGPEDVLHVGPIWDFDTCMGNDGAANTDSYCHNGRLFRYLLAAPAFYRHTQALYSQYRSVFAEMADNARTLGGQIEASAHSNYLRWDVLGSESVKPGGLAYANTYGEAVEQVRSWLEGRSAAFSIPNVNVVTSRVNDDFSTLTIHYEDDGVYESVRFALWNRDAADRGVMWYDAVLEDGVWTADADLSFFQKKGMYQVVVYPAGRDQSVADGLNYVEHVKKNPHEMELRLSEDMNELTVKVQDSLLQCSSVNILIWSTKSNQADLQMFDAGRDIFGNWRCTVDLSCFEAEGEYNVHVFGFTDEGEQRLNAATFTRYRIWKDGEGPYELETVFSQDGTTLTITITDPSGDCRLVNFLVWSRDGHQEDIQSFGGEKTQDGRWTATVDMTQFQVYGEYIVHAYGERPYGYTMLKGSSFSYGALP
jgi:hypothetical protein